MPLVSLMIFIISPYHLESGNDITEDVHFVSQNLESIILKKTKHLFIAYAMQTEPLVH